MKKKRASRVRASTVRKAVLRFLLKNDFGPRLTRCAYKGAVAPQLSAGVARLLKRPALRRPSGYGENSLHRTVAAAVKQLCDEGCVANNYDQYTGPWGIDHWHATRKGKSWLLGQSSRPAVQSKRKSRGNPSRRLAKVR